MNQKTKPNPTLLQFMLRAQQLAGPVAKSDTGYGMMMTSILSILMFSMMGAYLTMSNLSKSATSAYINGNSTFYVAESGLNSRAEEVRKKFIGYARPTGTRPTGSQPTAQIQSCLTGGSSDKGIGDFACKNYSYSSSAPSGKSTLAANGGYNISLLEKDDSRNYVATTFVQQIPSDGAQPTVAIIPEGDLFGGMSMQEYSYQVSSSAKTLNEIDSNDTDKTVLQMSFKARLVPLFQFAAFYDGDLEILPGAAMTLSGPVHSNGSLYLGASPSLTIDGAVSSVGSIFSKRKNDNSTYANNVVRIVTSAKGVTPQVTTSLLAANANTATTNALDPANLKATFDKRVQAGVSEITVPQVGFLGKTDSQQTDGIGIYYGKADLRIEYQPNKTIPIAITTIKTGVTGANSSTCTGLNISSDRNNKDKLVCAQLSSDQLRSLQQPVLVKAQNTYERDLAPSSQTFASSPTSTDIATAVSLQKIIVKSTTQLSFGGIDTALTSTSPILNGLSSTQKSPFLGKTPKEIANKAGYFYLPPAIQLYNTFNNNRESDRLIQMVQTNIQSLAFWNRDNIVVNASNTDLSQDEVLFKRIQNPTATGSRYATVCNGGTTDPRKKSLQCLGLAANDTVVENGSEGGLVVHATVNTSVFDYPKTATTYTAKQSPYGFAFVGGSNLPGALTIASDQAVYVQGDYNYFDSSNTTNPNNTVVTHAYNMSNNTPASSGLKEPASILADSLNVLSNNCKLATTDRLNCGINNTAPAASNTAMNVAFLAGTDVTAVGNYNGGLENYPRFHENWSGRTLLYRGSFISLGMAQNVSGTWANQVYNAPGRNWNYDLAFNDANNLPPLTPRLVYIRQDVFGRY